MLVSSVAQALVVSGPNAAEIAPLGICAILSSFNPDICDIVKEFAPIVDAIIDMDKENTAFKQLLDAIEAREQILNKATAEQIDVVINFCEAAPKGTFSPEELGTIACVVELLMKFKVVQITIQARVEAKKKKGKQFQLWAQQM